MAGEWIRFEQVGPVGARITLLDGKRQPLEVFVPLITHSVGGQPVGFAVVHPWLEERGSETEGVWTHEDDAFLSRVRPLIPPFDQPAWR